MACEVWRGKLDAYLDGELPAAEAAALAAHLRECASCAADALGRVQIKRAVAVAGKRYEPSVELRARIAQGVAAQPQKKAARWSLLWVPVFTVAIVAFAVAFYLGREGTRQQRVYSELADLHVGALASATPVEVISTDRHTVKPWFQGKIPFTFNLPELQGTDFTLVGGRVTYLAQAPGAHLIYQYRKHEISVFIFQDRGEETAGVPSGPAHAQSFNFASWTENGLRYFVVGDVSADQVQALSKLLRDAG